MVTKASVRMRVVPSTLEPGRLSARTLDGHTLRTAVDLLGAKPGDEIVVSLAPKHPDADCYCQPGDPPAVCPHHRIPESE